MDWFRDKVKQELFVFLAESTSQNKTKLYLINITTKKIHHILRDGNPEILQASLDQGPSRLLLLLKQNGNFKKMKIGLKFLIFQKKRNLVQFKSNNKWSKCY